VHHEGKSTEGAGTGRTIRGASALLGAVDQALMLSRPASGPTTHRVLRAAGRYGESPSSVVIALDGNTYRVDSAKSGDQAAVLAVLTTTPQTLEAVSGAAKLSESRTADALKALVAKGLAVRQGKGVKGDPHTYCRAQSIAADDEPWDDPA